MIPAPRANVSSPLCKKPNPSSLASSSSSSSSSSSRAVDIYVDGTETSAEVKQAIFEATGIPPHAQEIEVNGKRLCDEVVLKDQCIKKGSALRVYGQSNWLPKDSRSESLNDFVDSLFVADYEDKPGPGRCSKGAVSRCCMRANSCDDSATGASHGSLPTCGRNRNGGFSLPFSMDLAFSVDQTQTIPEWFCTMLMSSFKKRKPKREKDCFGACAVCQCDYLPSDTVVVTPCNHEFHQECLKPWLSVNITCPQCRFDLSEVSFNLPPEEATVKTGGACSLKEVADDIFVDTGKLSLDVDAFDTGLSVKEKIEEITQIPSQLQRLSHNDKQLLDSEPLKSHSLNDGNEIDMIVRLDNAYSEVPSTHKGKAKRSKRVEKGKACLNSCTSKKVKDSTELPWDDIKCIEDPTLSKPKMPKPLMSLYSLRGSSTNCDASIHKVIGTSQLQGDSCAVCKCDLQTGGEDVVVETPCRHRFHKDCLTPWLLIGNKTCPQCRFSLSSDGRAAEKRASLDVDKKECKTCDRRVRRKVLDDTFGGIL
mmetsp:Transcript_4193/g.5687  ORF Transcript_4193/g.5687 Transcript_4193/m.5687 type:complete len:536 (+) Transcript_4193:22-1629(+)